MENITLEAERKKKKRRDSQLNQRRHRAKQREYYINLSTGNEKLDFEIDEMEKLLLDLHRIVTNVKVHAAQVRLKVVMELYTLFQFGIQQNGLKQFAFIQRNMIPNVRIGEYEGQIVFWNQMQSLSNLFPNLEFMVESTRVIGLSHEIVNVVVNANLKLNYDAIMRLYPNLHGQHEMVQFLIGKDLSVTLYQTIYFDGQFIQRVITNCDWMVSWRKLTRCYRDALIIVQNAKLDNQFHIHLKNQQ